MEEASKHEFFMRQAIVEAKKAEEKDDVPVGAVIVFEGRVIARAHNQRELLKGPDSPRGDDCNNSSVRLLGKLAADGHNSLRNPGTLRNVCGRLGAVEDRHPCLWRGG